MANETPVQAINPNEELRNCYTEKGELSTQVEKGVERLQAVQVRIAQLLGFPTVQVPVLGFNTVQAPR